MRADRLLSIILILKNRKQLSAKALAVELEVSERTIYRDMDALSGAGVPVYSIHGPRGGFCLDPQFQTDLTGLSAGEIRELFINRLPGPLTELGMGDHSNHVFQKLLSALPSFHQEIADQVHKRIHVDPVQWFRPSESTPHLRKLEEAMWRNCRVQVVYRGKQGDRFDGEVAPYGLVAKTSIWYLVGESEGQIRVFRASRFQSVSHTEAFFTCPETFDVAEFWTDWCRQFEQSLPVYPVELNLSPEACRVLPQVVGETAHVYLKDGERVNDNGWVRTTISFETLEEACRKVMGFGATVEVVAPLELRRRIREQADELASFYRMKEE
jgi:predicted DNA-binding transcriptional regulator YafY